MSEQEARTEAWSEYARSEGLVWDMPNSSERRAFMAGAAWERARLSSRVVEAAPSDTDYTKLAQRLRDESGVATMRVNERVALMDKAAEAIEALSRTSQPVQVEVTEARELPEGSVFIGYYYPPTFDIVPKARKLASVQLTRGRSIVYGERMEYPLDQSWERIEVLYRPTALGGGE